MWNLHLDIFFRNHPLVLGENYSNFYRVMGILAAAISSNVVDDDENIKKRIRVILKQAQVCHICLGYLW